MPVWEVQPVDEKSIQDLSRAFLLTPLQARLIALRGVTSGDEADRYLSPSFEYLHDPLLFDEMEAAVEILHAAIAGRERILIHGDYDADGICGTALVYETLLGLGADVQYFVPDRSRDGYGLARRVAERGLKVNLGLVVSVDCGSSDREVVSLLVRNGVKVIITDHHETRDRIPEADAFLNPKLPGERYPFKKLSGAGIAFKLMQGLEKSMGMKLSLEGKLDLVSLGTIGDYVPLTGENRVLVSLGLEKLKEWRRPGLHALRTRSGMPAEGFSARKVSFTLIPRLNSPGRMGSARDVVELLVTRDAAEASRMAAEIEEKNRKRRKYDSLVTEEASYLADIVLKRNEPSSLVFSSSSWHEGVVGIGAARLAETYELPSVLIAVRDGLGKGSARAAGMVNIKEALERCSDCLIEYGGHKEAGGFSIEETKIPDFQRLFEQAVEELSEGTQAPSLHADAEIGLDEGKLELVSFLDRLRPFGPGNREPVFLLRRLEVIPGVRIVGDSHLKLSAKNEHGGVAEFIGFSLAKRWSPQDLEGMEVDMLVHLRKNTYMGKLRPQLNMRAIRFSSAGESSPACGSGYNLSREDLEGSR